MDDGLEVYFCDLCNTSVPEGDLEGGRARRAKGKVVGACCLADLGVAAARPAPTAGGGGGGTPAILGVGIVLLLAVAGAAGFLDWRLADERLRIDQRFDSVQSAMLGLDRRIAAVDERVADRATASALQALARRLEQGVEGLEAEQRDLAERWDGRLDSLRERQGQLTVAVEGLRRVVEEQQAGLLGVERELSRVAGDVAAIRATPRPADGRRAGAGVPPDLPPRDGGGAADDGVPPEIAHLLASLEDSDPAVRFEAVERLIASKHEAARQALQRMVKDPDAFIRRVSVEGLASFPHVESVDTLIDALADPAGIVRHDAYAALRELTGQRFPFDATASADARLRAQRRWRDWWAEQREGFTF